MIVMAAGLVLIGGSAVAGIALAASQTPDSPSMHPMTTSSPDDRDGTGKNEDANEQGTGHGSATPSGTCTPDKDDATTGEREDGPAASRSPEGDDVHRSGGATSTMTRSPHPESTVTRSPHPESAEAPEATGTMRDDHAGADSDCDD
jgi:hypothetical protein